MTQSLRAGITFPVGRIGRYLRQGRYSHRVGAGAPVFAAAVMEYLCAEILELAGNVCAESKKKLITPRHIVLAIQNDDELKQYLRNGCYHKGGIAPAGIHDVLLHKVNKNTFKGWHSSQAV